MTTPSIPPETTPPGGAPETPRAAEAAPPAAAGAALGGASLKHKAFGSAIWTFVRLATDQLFNFILFALLARLLGPTAFGVFALAFLYTELGKVITSAGLMDALIREPTLDAQTKDSVFWANMAIATVLAVSGLFLAHPIGDLMGAPDAAPLIQVLGLLLPISAAGAAHMALRLRDFGHRTMALRSLLSGIIGGIAALVAAWYGWGAWSFVVQRMVFEVVGTILSWRAYPWVPGRHVSFRRLQSLFAFSSNMLLTQLLVLLLVRIQDLIVGRMIGPAAVGIYRTAWKMTEVIAQGTIVPFSTVALPTLSRLQHDRAGFSAAYRRLVGTAALISLPALTGFGLLAPEAILVLFGPQWSASVPVAWVLSGMAVPFTLGFFGSPALAALGHSSTIAKLAAFQLTATVLFSVLAAPYGLTAVAGAFVLRAYLTLPIQLIALQRLAGIGIAGTLQAIAAPFFATLVMAVAILALRAPVAAWLDQPMLFLAAMAGGGALVYALALVLFGGRKLRQQAMQLKQMLRKGKGAPLPAGQLS